MTLPHHHVFNALQQSIIKSVDIQAILPHLVSNKVIPVADLPRYESKNGMKILIGFLRNQTYEDFLKFVECIFLTQRDDPSKSKAAPVVDYMIRAVQDFDQREKKSYAKEIIAVKLKYMSLVVGEEEEGGSIPQDKESTEVHELARDLSKTSIAGICGNYVSLFFPS